MKIPVIGLHTPAQTAKLQADTGMLVTINRNGAYLVPRDEFKGLLDGYEQTDRDAWLGQMGAFQEGAA